MGLGLGAELGNNNFTENRVDIQVISKKTYESGIPSVKINVEYPEKDEERNRRNLSMIEERCFNRDEKKQLSRDETYHEASVDSITKSYGTTVKEKVGSIESNKKTKIMSARKEER